MCPPRRNPKVGTLPDVPGARDQPEAAGSGYTDAGRICGSWGVSTGSPWVWLNHPGDTRGEPRRVLKQTEMLWSSKRGRGDASRSQKGKESEVKKESVGRDWKAPSGHDPRGHQLERIREDYPR